MTEYYGDKFTRLVRKYNHDCAMMSFVVTDHPAYKEMVSMGIIIVPLILEEILLDGGSVLWYHLLHDITGHDLEVKPEQMGKIKIIGKLWLDWGTAMGYIG